MSVIYSEILWLGGFVLILSGAALIGLFARSYPDENEYTKPLLLSAEQRAVLLREKDLAITSAFGAKKAAKKAVKARHRELARGRAGTARDDSAS